MRITFLGTGTSQGVPFIGCSCAVCTSTDKRDNRLRTSVLIETTEATIVIDSGPDFRQQMLRTGVTKLDALVFTHGHKDHTAGMDDIRAFNFHSSKAVNVYATEATQEVLKREFNYVFAEHHYPGIPQVNLHTITNSPFSINGVELIPIRVLHYKMEVFGFRVGNFSYITDANHIAPEELAKTRDSEVFVLNALRHQKHVSHYALEEAIGIAQAAAAKKSYFTHISHQLGLHAEVEQQLPENMHLAYDGLTLEL